MIKDDLVTCIWNAILRFHFSWKELRWAWNDTTSQISILTSRVYLFIVNSSFSIELNTIQKPFTILQLQCIIRFLWNFNLNATKRINLRKEIFSYNVHQVWQINAFAFRKSICLKKKKGYIFNLNKLILLSRPTIRFLQIKMAACHDGTRN